MKCLKCSAELAAPTKFCGSCGADLSTQNETRSRADFSLDWVMGIFKDEGYEVTKTEGTAIPQFIAKKPDTAPKFIIEYRDIVRLLMFTTSWAIKPPGLLERLEFYKAVNNANAKTIGFQCSVQEKDLTTLYIQPRCPATISDIILARPGSRSWRASCSVGDPPPFPGSIIQVRVPVATDPKVHFSAWKVTVCWQEIDT
jgi:hypothetical protein